jgi:glycosyltransferase involved in cell wall biosynthesis
MSDVSAASPGRSVLALIEGFMKPRDSQAHGTQQAAYLICQALAKNGRYSALDVYQDRQRSIGQCEFTVPRNPPTRAFDKLSLLSSEQKYSAIYVANGDQMVAAPHVLRPNDDWAPVICSVGTAHANSQWLNLFLSLASGAIRATDGLIFKSRAALNLFETTVGDWSRRFGFSVPATAQTVIPNGIDVDVNKRSDLLRQEMRTRLRIADSDVVFLSFSRLSPGTKGDHQALIVRWREVVARLPQALLVLSGAVVDRAFVLELRSLARAAGVGDRVLVVDNPFEVVPNARGQLMSAADVFVHLSTGVEETSSLVVHEAMGHALPVITTRWAGMSEIVVPGETGFLLETRNAPVAPSFAKTLFGQSDVGHLLAASRVVSSDWRAFVAASFALGDDHLRRTFAAAARRRAEMQSLEVIAGRFVQFFDATSRVAEAAWAGCLDWRPLVDLDAVVSAQATRKLAAHEKVRPGDFTRAELVVGGLNGESTADLEVVLGHFKDDQHKTMGELASALARTRPGPPGNSADAYANGARLLIRLLNIGVLELA